MVAKNHGDFQNNQSNTWRNPLTRVLLQLALVLISFAIRLTSLISFRYEKKFSGTFIGELARHAIIKLAKYGLIFKECDYSAFEKAESFPSSWVSLIEK